MPTRTRYQSHRRDLPDGLIIHDTVRGASLACARPKEERLGSMYLKNKSGRRVHLPGPEENKAINAGIAADPETRELSEIEMATLKPVRGLPVGSGKNHSWEAGGGQSHPMWRLYISGLCPAGMFLHGSSA
jgi:hypothetical protein